jgi:hypothetical protein
MRTLLLAVLGFVLFVAAALLAFLALGAAMSEPGEHVSKATLVLEARALLAGAAAAAWTAGVLWIGGIVDAAWRLGARRRAPAVVFIVLALVFAVPQILFETLGDTRTLSDLRLVTWVLTPPSLIIAILRFAGVGRNRAPEDAAPSLHF